jgi:hypothetical protein
MVASMTEDTTVPEVPRLTGQRRTRWVLIVAVVVGLLGAITGEAKYEEKSRIVKRQVPETVPAACQTVRSFIDKSSGEVIPAFTILSVEDCQRLSRVVPQDFIKKITKTVQVEREVKEFYNGRDLSAEIASRGFRFIIGVAIGALIALLVLAIYARRAVFDVRFNKFVTPMILSIFFVICLVAACLAGFGFWLQTISDFSEDGLGTALFTALWTAPLITLAVILVCLLFRLIFESVMVIFRIAEDLRRIRDK